MKALVLTIFTLLMMSVVVFFVPQFRSETVKILSYSKCDTPILYRLGALDPKFGLSQDSVLTVIQNAADIWGNAYGKPLFSNSMKATLTINFVYDQRSELNTQIDRLQSKLDQKGVTLKQQVDSYETDFAEFRKKLADYNSQVEQINRSGGASPEVYKTLMAQQNTLTIEGNSLNARANQLNLTSNNFNSQVEKLDQSIGQFNQEIAQKPEEGLYDGSNNTITIYFASDPSELTHTLTHEFGHALGMQHTTDSQSIMFPDTSSFLTVTSQDKEQLEDVCQEQLIPSHWLVEFTSWFYTILKPFVPSLSK